MSLSVETDIFTKLDLKDDREIEVQLNGGKGVRFMQSIVQMNGHELAKRIREEVFLPLKGFSSEQKLLAEVTRSVIVHCPNYIPNSVVQVLRKVLAD